MSKIARDRRWQPIASAPRDGTKILIYVPDGRRCVEKGRMTTGGWKKGKYEGRPPGVMIARWIVPAEGEHLSEARQKLVDKHGGHWSSRFTARWPIDGTPTLWMPMPWPSADEIGAAMEVTAA